MPGEHEDSAQSSDGEKSGKVEKIEKEVAEVDEGFTSYRVEGKEQLGIWAVTFISVWLCWETQGQKPFKSWGFCNLQSFKNS